LQYVWLGDRVCINRDSWIVTLPDGAKEEENSFKLIIKSDAEIGMGATIAAARQVVVGEHVLLARNVYISDHGHAYEDIAVPVSEQGIGESKPVSIGRHSWLGQNVAVLPGVSIGEHCVIGANSVVNRSIPDFSIAVGSPARVVRQYNLHTAQWEKTA